jgi:chromosomal replication initiation ATPase DnaA
MKIRTATDEALNQCLIDVEEVTGIKPNEILSKNRSYENVCLARFFVYAMMRSHENGFSYAQIAKAMGRTHGSVMNGIETLAARLTYEKRLKARAKLLKQKGYRI